MVIGLEHSDALQRFSVENGERAIGSFTMPGSQGRRVAGSQDHRSQDHRAACSRRDDGSHRSVRLNASQRSPIASFYEAEPLTP